MPLLCPSTNHGAKGKFSVLTNGQEWGWGPTESLWSSKSFPRVGTDGLLLEAKTRPCFLKLDGGQGVPDPDATCAVLEKGANPGLIKSNCGPCS